MQISGTVNVAADPRFFESRGDLDAMVSFPVASSRRVRGEDYFDGYFDVSVYGAQAETIAKTIKKGDRVLLTGRLKQTKRKDGSYHVGIVAWAVGQSLEFAHRSSNGADASDEALEAASAGPARDENGRFVSAS